MYSLQVYVYRASFKCKRSARTETDNSQTREVGYENFSLYNHVVYVFLQKIFSLRFISDFIRYSHSNHPILETHLRFNSMNTAMTPVALYFARLFNNCY